MDLDDAVELATRSDFIQGAHHQLIDVPFENLLAHFLAHSQSSDELFNRQMINLTLTIEQFDSLA